MDGTGRDKPGYEKLVFCAKQAAQDRLQYFWVDTCCIDRTNSTELQYAITSMFQWYQNARRCYVYLADFLGDDDDAGFREHKWFTRGWTLQELVAPASVEFFRSDGSRLGDKRSLEPEICGITGIAVKALRGDGALSHFAVEERFKWAEGRRTKREEDWAYCLQGIFGVSMALIYGEGRDRAIHRLKKEIVDVAAREEMPRRPRATWVVPFERNPSFSSRHREMMAIRSKLFAGDYTTRVAVTGLGGVGKTQLVLELLYRTRGESSPCSIIWIPATSKEGLEQGYLNAAKKLGIPGCEEKDADVKALVRDHLSSEEAGQWLLVFDNADDIDMWLDVQQPGQAADRLLDYLPKSSSGSIIFTSRDRKAAVKLAGSNVVEITELDESGGLELLKKYLIDKDLVGRQMDGAIALLSRLMYLPLAIVQAAMYINANGMDLDEYLLLMKGQESDEISLLSEEFEDMGRYRETKNPVAATWLISFEQIRQRDRDQLAADYLSFMACVDPKDIALSMLPPAPSPKQMKDALGTLQGYSFITMQADDTAVTLHRLVHLAMRNWLRKENLLSAWTGKAFGRLADLLQDAGVVQRAAWRSCMPHAAYALMAKQEEDRVGNSKPDKNDVEYDDRIRLLHRHAYCLSLEGRHHEAEAFNKQLLEIERATLGEDHEETNRSMINLAWSYRQQGRLDEAQKIQEQVVERCKSTLGEDHTDTLKYIQELASTYRRQGRLSEAEALQVQVLEARKRKLGDTHPHTLRTMHALAHTHITQNRLDEAEQLLVPVLESRLEQFGKEHPNTLQSMGSLALLYLHQGQLDKAEEISLQLWEVQKRVLGEHNPDTLVTLHNLAVTYMRQRRLEEAERTFGEVLEVNKRMLGARHPNIAAILYDLAHTLRLQGRRQDAVRLMLDCAEIRQQQLGSKHPQTQHSQDLLEEWLGESEPQDETMA